MRLKNMLCGFLGLLFLTGCANQADSGSTLSAAIEQEVLGLTTIEAQKQYLRQILADDQAMREGNRGAYLQVQYGKESPEYQDYLQQVMAVDERNLLKVQSLLATHGYPKWLEVGYEEAQTPWLIIHHSTDVALRNSYAEQFFLAARNGNLDYDNLALYLGRTYQLTQDELFKMEGSYTVQDEIDTLTRVLNLTAARERAEEVFWNR